MIRIPKLGYLQYRNKDGNTTFNRNGEIQKLQKFISNYYENKIQDRFKELKIKDNKLEPYKMYWKQPYNYHEQHATLYEPFNKDCVSIIVPTYKRVKKLERAINSILSQTYQKFEILIIGDNCPVSFGVVTQSGPVSKGAVMQSGPVSKGAVMQSSPELNKYIVKYNDKRIRWWNLDSNNDDLGATPRNYALKKLVRTELVAYLDDDNIWKPNHLELLIKALKENDADYAFSSIELEEEISDNELDNNYGNELDNNYGNELDNNYDKEYIESRHHICNIICTEPHIYRVDTSALIHKLSLVNTYGYWKSGKEIYNHDWEFVSRWKNHKYATTQIPTIKYTINYDRCNPKILYEYYKDQDPVLFNDIKNE